MRHKTKEKYSVSGYCLLRTYYFLHFVVLHCEISKKSLSSSYFVYVTGEIKCCEMWYIHSDHGIILHNLHYICNCKDWETIPWNCLSRYCFCIIYIFLYFSLDSFAFSFRASFSSLWDTFLDTIWFLCTVSRFTSELLWSYISPREEVVISNVYTKPNISYVKV